MADNFWSLWDNQNPIPHLKVLVCGITASSSQWCGCIFTLSSTHLNLALLLHKQGLVATGVGTTVHLKRKLRKYKIQIHVETEWFFGKKTQKNHFLIFFFQRGDHLITNYKAFSFNLSKFHNISSQNSSTLTKQALK